MPAVTTRQIVQQALGMFSPVPSGANDFVCHCCLGPVGPGYAICYACSRVFSYGAAPLQLQRMIVPMTSALNPSRWYTWLLTYKSGYPERSAEIASLAHEYLTTHSGAIDALLGGAPSMLTLVPSKRGHTFSTQPLRMALSSVRPLAERLEHTLIFSAGATIGRWMYNPHAFVPASTSVQGARIVLIEDAWVTGATAVSAAGALLSHGAQAVLTMPLARIVDANFWNDTHPYRIMMKLPYDPWSKASWPR